MDEFPKLIISDDAKREYLTTLIGKMHGGVRLVEVEA